MVNSWNVRLVIWGAMKESLWIRVKERQIDRTVVRNYKVSSIGKNDTTCTYVLRVWSPHLSVGICTLACEAYHVCIYMCAIRDVAYRTCIFVDYQKVVFKNHGLLWASQCVHAYIYAFQKILVYTSLKMYFVQLHSKKFSDMACIQGIPAWCT